MKKTRYLAGLFLIYLVAVIAIPARRGYACSCVMPGTPVEELSQSTVVFAGRVSEIMDTPAVNGVRVTFQVERVWKGPADIIWVVTTAQGSASCGFEFQRGQLYLVYARGTLSQLTTSICSRTVQLSGAGEDLAALGEGVAVPGHEEIPGLIWLPWAVWISLGAALVLLGIIIWRVIWKGSADKR